MVRIKIGAYVMLTMFTPKKESNEEINTEENGGGRSTQTHRRLLSLIMVKSTVSALPHLVRAIHEVCITM